MENKLSEIFNVILEEIKVNKEFEGKINAILFGDKTNKKHIKKKDVAKPEIDPVLIAKDSKEVLENKLIKLSIDELKGIIKYYDMDSSNSYSRWRKKDRLMNYIVEVALVRSKKGEAFRE